MAKPNFVLPIRGRLGISSYFCDMRRGDKHIGLDILPIDDTILFYCTSGNIIYEGWDKMSGWRVDYLANIWDGRRLRISYSHMAHRSPHRVGDFIDTGQWAGTMGSTGNSTGVHLHMEVEDSAVYPRHRLDPKFFMEQAQLIDKQGLWR